MAVAGVGKPRNDSVCRESMLNFARRHAAKTGMRNEINGTIFILLIDSIGIFVLCNIKWYRITPGATPNEITSARESNSFPASLFAFNSLAAVPSKKSKITASPIKYEEISIEYSKADIIANNPQIMFNEVI